LTDGHERVGVPHEQGRQVLVRAEYRVSKNSTPHLFSNIHETADTETPFQLDDVNAGARVAAGAYQ
jgi:hypothetical protein